MNLSNLSKKTLSILLVFALVFCFTLPVFAAQPGQAVQENMSLTSISYGDYEEFSSTQFVAAPPLVVLGFRAAATLLLGGSNLSMVGGNVLRWSSSAGFISFSFHGTTQAGLRVYTALVQRTGQISDTVRIGVR